MEVLSERLIEEIDRQYDIPDVISVGKVEGGKMGNNFWLETKAEKYFFREYRITSPARIKEIHDAKAYFAGQGMPVILPILTRSGGTSFSFKDKIYSLFPYVNGVNVPREGLREEHLSKMGKFLAEMHLAGKNPPAFIKEKERVWNKEKFIERARAFLAIIEKKKVQDDFDRLALKKLNRQIDLAEKNRVEYSIEYPLHLTHNDFHNYNIFFDKDGEISRIFDWEKVQLGTRAKEVARALELNVFERGFTNEAFEKAKVFLRSYRDIYPLSKEEFLDGVKKRYLNIMHSKWIEEEHYEKKNFRVDPFLLNDYDRIIYYNEHLDEYVDRLM